MQMSRQILVAAAVLTTLSVVVSGQPGFTVYKLSISWQPSVCNVQPASRPCTVAPEDKFTIHGLWPTLPGDVSVIAYANNGTCTQTQPTSSADMLQKIQPIRVRLEQNWPTLVPGNTNEGFWTHEWEKHGMCSQYPADPKTYFEAALTVHNDFTQVPKDAKITLGQEYTAIEVLNKLKKRYGIYPEIACNAASGGRLQLLELRFCYNIKTKSKVPWQIVDCPGWLAGECKSYDDKIILPAAPPPPPPPPIVNHGFSDNDDNDIM